MIKRVVELFVQDGFEDACIEAKVEKKEVNAATGYLANWAVHSPRYSKVQIDCKRQGDIMATYFDAEGQVTYELFAQLSESGYSFHS